MITKSAVARDQSIEIGEKAWGTWLCILFRFVVIFLPLETLLDGLGSLPFPWIRRLAPSATWQLQKIVPWVGHHMFDVRPGQNLWPWRPDSSFWWVYTLSCFVIAAASAAIWSILDRNRRSYARFYRWARLWARLTLATGLAVYAAYKIIPVQFPPPADWAWAASYPLTLGDLNLHVLLWSFMESSPFYTVFTGTAEMIAVVLLFIPRLEAAGALVALADMTNVLALNIGYDIHQKIHCLGFILMALFILAPEFPRLLRFFVLDRQVEPRASQPLFRSRRLNLMVIGLQLVFGFAIISGNLVDAYQAKQRLEASRSSHLFGYWRVEQFKVNGQDRPPLLTDRIRWRRVIFYYPTSAWVQFMDGSVGAFSVDKATKSNGMNLTNVKEVAPGSCFICLPSSSDYRIQIQQNHGELTATGTVNGRHVIATLIRETPTFRLQRSHDQWVNDLPQ